MDKYIFLDFNGTVLDDLDLCLELLNDLLKRNNNKPLVSKEAYLDIFGFPVKDYYVKAGLDFNIESFESMAKYFIEEYTRRNVIECHIYPDFNEFVLEAKKQGYKLVLCSASKYDLLVDQLVSFGIKECFDYILGLDNYHAVSKVDIAKDFIEKMSIDKNYLYFIGDTNHDDLVAKECGGKSILVARGHQSIKVLEKCNSLIANSLLEALKIVNNVAIF